MNSLFVAWQSPTERSWFTVGRLMSVNHAFEFDYTRGALQASDSGFVPFSAFPDLHVSYRSQRLFPFFANRLLSRSRPEFGDFVNWVSPHNDSDDPVALLAQSGGSRMTDSLELFPLPERDEGGTLHIHFFAHGLGHMPTAASHRAELLKDGEQVLVVKDFQNASDRNALMLRTTGEYDQDVYFLGYLPRYLASDLAPWIETGDRLSVQVLRVNRPPAPVQFRLLCCMRFRPPSEVPLFQGEEFLPIAQSGTLRPIPKLRPMMEWGHPTGVACSS